MPTLAGAGEGGFTGSTITDLGRYLGRAEFALADLGRSDDALAAAVAWGVPFVSGLLISSVEDRLCCPEILLRVIVFVSGVLCSRFPAWVRGRLSPPIDARGAAGWGLTALRRREASLVFLEGFSSELLSLLLTPAMMALPTEARFKDCRREEALVVGGLVTDLGLPPWGEGSGMLLI